MLGKLPILERFQQRLHPLLISFPYVLCGAQEHAAEDDLRRSLP